MAPWHLSSFYLFFFNLFFLPSDGFARDWNLLKADTQASKKWIGV